MLHNVSGRSRKLIATLFGRSAVAHRRRSRCSHRHRRIVAEPLESRAMLAGVDINGGLSWTGWESRGYSNQPGVYGSGGTAEVYEVYTNTFAFDRATHAITGNPTQAVSPAPSGFDSGRLAPTPAGQFAVSQGAFENGNTILGVGVRVVSGGSIAGFKPTMRFDLDNDSYRPASNVGGTDGRTSFTSVSEQGDFTVQFEGASSWRGSSISVQCGARSGQAATYTGTNDTVLLPGGVGSGTSYDFAFRAFAQPAANAYQMFIDVTAIPRLYGSTDPTSVYKLFFPTKSGVAAIGDHVTLSLNGLGANNVVFAADVTLPPVDLDVDSDNTATVERSSFEEAIEEAADKPGVIVPVGGERARMIVDVPQGRTAALGFDAGAASKVKVLSSSGAVVLDTERLSTTIAGGGPQTFWIEAFAPSQSMADIAFTLATTGAGPASSDTVRATAVALTAQANGIVSADDGKLWVYAGVSDTTRLSGDSGTVAFELLKADGATAGVTGSAELDGGFAYTVLTLPDSLLRIDPEKSAASTYRVRARYKSLTVESSETVVIPGLAADIQAIANVGFTNKPGFTFDITTANAPMLRDFAGVGRVTVTATVRDRLGNLVEDGTPVIWGTVDDGFNPDDVLAPGTETTDGVATFAIAGNRIAPVARLSVTADQKTIRGFLSGGELRVSLELLDINNQPAGDRIINLDDRWWFSTRSETIRVRATVRRQDGTPVGAGVPVKFHDTKRLLDDAAVLTNQAGQAVADLFVPNDRAVWSILGRNVVTASAAGYSAQELTRIDGTNGAALRPPVELEFSTAVLAGDKTQDGTLALADPTALSRLGAEVDVPFAAKSTITLRNLAPGEPYRLEVPDNAPVVLRVPGSAPASQVRFVAPPSNGTNVSTFQIQVESKGGMTGTRVEVVKPLLYLEATWWNWFQDPVGYSVKGDTAGTIIVGPASAAARIGQITQSIAGGALFGAGGLDASLAGDIGLSMIPGIGVVADVRDVGKSLLKLVPIDLGLGPFDWREAAIAGFGILTEILPPADAIVDVYRSMYKIAKQVPAVMPVFLSIEPLFTKALTSLFDFTPVTASSVLTASGNFASVAARASSTSFGADDIFRFLEGVPGIGKHNARRLLAHTEIGKVLKADAVFQGKYADLVRLGGTKFGDDLETIFQAFGKDALVRMVKHGTGSLEDFGAGFNAMATALRRHSADGTWQNTALLDSLKASPEDAADIFTNIGTTSRRVQEANIRFGKGIAGESDVSQAIALVIGRASGSTGHSFVSTIDQLRHFSGDLMTLTDVSRSVDQMRSAAALIRRFRSDKAYLPTQAGRLFELQEVAAALRDNSDTVLSFNNFRKGLGGRTDIDILLNGKAIELKLTLNRVNDQDIITKFFKYHAAVGPGKPLELRSLDSEASMQAFVEGAFKTYLDMPDTTKWPRWLRALSEDPATLVKVKNAISYSQAASTRYNFFAAAG